MSRDHRKLRVFVEADALVIDVYRATEAMPSHERFGLQSQLRRAAVSVVTNIVEGAGRSSEREYVRFLHVAAASARECSYLLNLAARLGYLSQPQAEALEHRYNQVQAMLFAAARALSLSPKP